MQSFVEEITVWLEERLKELEYASVFVVDVVFHTINTTKHLEVYIDSDEGSVKVSEITRFSRYILEEGEKDEKMKLLLGENLKLEVSSPGAKRSLLLDRQYKKNIGRYVRIKYRENEMVQSEVGVLREMIDDVIVLEVAGNKKGEKQIRKIARANVIEARIEFKL